MPQIDQKQSEVDGFLARIESNLVLAKAKKYRFRHIPGFKSTLTHKHFEKIYQEILTLEEPNKSKLQNLQPGESLYFKRDPNDPNARTYNIVRDIHGEIQLYIEPKSKRLDNTKRDMENVGGGFKVRKIAVRADTAKAQPVASLVEYIENTPEAMEEYKFQVKVAQEFDGKPGFARCIFGNEMVKTDNGRAMNRVVTYSPYRPASLLDLVEERWMPSEMSKFTKDQQLALYIDIMRQVIDIVEKMHSVKLEHKDIKLENFLIDYNKKTQRFEVEVIDFGMFQDFGDLELARGTKSYFPPWLIQMWGGGRSVQDYEYLSKFKNATDDAGKQNYKVYKIFDSFRRTAAYYALMHNQKPDVNNKIYIPSLTKQLRASGKHDIWSVGVMFYELLYDYNDKPQVKFETIQKDDFLNSIFKFDASTKDPDILYQNIGDLEDVKKAFHDKYDTLLSELENIQELPDPDDEQALSDSNAPLAHTGTFKNPSNQQGIMDGLVKFCKEFEAAMQSIEKQAKEPGSAKKLTMSDEMCSTIITMCPLGATILASDYPTFFSMLEVDHLTPKERAEIYSLIQTSDQMIAGDLTVDLNDLVVRLLAVRAVIDDVYLAHPKDRVGEPDWFDFASWKTFLDAVLFIAYTKIDDEQTNTAKTPARRSSLSLPKMFSRTNKVDNIKVKDHSVEREKCLHEIYDLIPAMIENLGEKSFVVSYGKPNSTI